MVTGTRVSRVENVAVHAAFFFSGVASLACEIVWFKLFGLVLGNNTFTASAVVTCFFVGLGLGSIVAGRLADRWSHLLRAYAGLELLLALTSALTTLALVYWPSWIEWFRPLMGLESATAMPLKVALAAALLLVPTMLMGSTLPVLARFLVRSRAELSRRVGWLYAFNTLVAALGSAVVGFVLIGTIGVLRTGMLASAVYFVIGAAAFVLSRGEARAASPDALGDSERPTPIDTQSARRLVVIFALSGFVSVSYEILWFRLLAVFSVNTVYAFSALLTVYLGGLVVGAVIASRWLAPRPERHLVWFARLQLAIAGAGLVTMVLLGRTPNLIHLAGVDLLSASGMLRMFGVVAAILILPTTLIGLTFPLASEITAERLSGLGRRLGLVYGLNTVVGALGSLFTGFVLIPWVGTQTTAFLLAFANVALFGAVVGWHPRVRREAGILRESLATVAVLVAAWAWLGPDYLRDSQMRAIGAELLSFRETAEGTFLLVAYDEDGTTYQQIVVNGTSYANNRPPGRRYMGLLGHLPTLVHPDPERALVICVGTGTTIGAVSLHDGLDEVWAVDLASEIFRIAPFFEPFNHSFHEAEHVRRVVADGRHFLTVTDERFDVLTFEPPPPIEAGVANLYSREFYQLARSRMSPDGVVAQWIPFHQGFEVLQRQLIRTMMEVYPHVSLWVADRHEGILIASNEPLQLDVAALARRMEEADLREDLHQIGIDRPEDLLATFVAADEALAAWVGDPGVVTDDLPTVERYLFYPNDPFTMADLLQHRTPVEEVLTSSVDRDALAASRAWTDALWTASDHEAVREMAAAEAVLRSASEHAPANVYLEYRRREFANRAALASRP